MRVLLLLIYAVLLGACTSAGRAAVADRLPPPDQEHLVWAVVLNTFVGELTEQLVIAGSTAPGPSGRGGEWAVLREFPWVGSELVQSFARANASTLALPAMSGIDVPIARIGEAELEEFGRAGGPGAYWEAFYAAYPASPGLIRLSRVGFDPTLTQALVYVHHTCGGRCGSATFKLLSKVDGEWAITEQLGVGVH